MAFIINSYNKYDQWDREHAQYKFEVNGNWYAIMKVEIEWGLPQLPYRVDQEKRLDLVHIFEKYEDALKFVNLVRSLN